MAERLNSNTWAYDIAKNVISTGEVVNEDVINQSIESILSTYFGERFFKPTFGSVMPLQIFENINVTTGEKLIDEIIDSIRTWEDRIEIIEDQVTLKLLRDDNAIILEIPYYIIPTQVTSFFKKKVIF